MIKVFVGYDTREDIAYQVCAHAIKSHTANADVIPLVLNDLKDRKLYWRDADKLGSTEFTFSRFLIPHLTNYNGWALFCDSDIIYQSDLNELFSLKDEKYAVMCVQHDYKPKEGLKMDGKQQTLYPRKNWSSVVLWNCGHPSNKKIDLKLVNDPNTTGAFLHRFSWLKDEEIGAISHEWNWLVGWYKEPEDGKPKGIHYTEGGPWFENYRNCDYHQIWKKYLIDMMSL